MSNNHKNRSIFLNSIARERRKNFQIVLVFTSYHYYYKYYAKEKYNHLSGNFYIKVISYIKFAMRMNRDFLFSLEDKSRGTSLRT